MQRFSCLSWPAIFTCGTRVRTLGGSGPGQHASAFCVVHTRSLDSSSEGPPPCEWKRECITIATIIITLPTTTINTSTCQRNVVARLTRRCHSRKSKPWPAQKRVQFLLDTVFTVSRTQVPRFVGYV